MTVIEIQRPEWTVEVLKRKYIVEASMDSSINKALFEAAGELIAAVGAGQPDNVPGGSEGDVLTWDDSEPTKMTWKQPPGGSVPQVNNYRLSLESGVAVSSTDQTSKTIAYLTQHKGNRLAIYDGGWEVDAPGELSIKGTDAQTGNTVNGSAVITGLTDTSQLIVGMEASGTGIGASAVISTIDSATQVTLDTNSTADGTGVTITFKVPADTNVDLFAIPVSGASKLRFGPLWTSDTARSTALSTQDGVPCLSGSASWRYLGPIRTTSTAGQFEDSVLRRLLYNIYNKEPRQLQRQDPQASWIYALGTARQSNANTDNKVEFILPFAHNRVRMTFDQWIGAGVANNIIGIGLDRVNSYADTSKLGLIIANYNQMIQATYDKMPGAGYHYLAMVEYAGASSTFYGGVYNLFEGNVDG